MHFLGGLAPYCASDRRMTISDEKQEELIQKLVDLRDNQNMALPEKITAAFDDRKKFVQIIDEYLCQPNNLVKDDYFDAIKTIIETCPEFLQPTRRRSMLPIHEATRVIMVRGPNSGLKFMLLFANVALRHDIEGKESRGYLLTRSRLHYIALQMVCKISVYEALKENDPPLFFTSDILEHKLVHSQALRFSIDILEYFFNLEPSCIQQTNDDNELPIHCIMYGGVDVRPAKCIETIEYLLQKGVLFSALKENIGGLFTEMPDRRDMIGPPGPHRYTGHLLLKVMIVELGKKQVWDCIERALSKSQNIDQLPILHQTIIHTPQYCSEVMNRFPRSVHVRDANNRLPIHVALERGMKFSLELTHLIALSQEHLREVDPVTKWPSYVLAGMGASCDLRTVYSLLHRYPEQSETCRDETGNKYILVESCKKMKIMH